MKSTITADGDLLVHAVAEPHSAWGAIRSWLEGVRQSYAERSMRAELAELDETILRDIGIATDEIGRVRAREDFTPRAWRL